MITFFYGEDADARSRAYSTYKDSCIEKHPDYLVTEMRPEEWSEAIFENAVAGASFFHAGSVLIGRDLFSHKDAPLFLSTYFDSQLPETTEIIFVDDDLPKDFVKKFAKKKGFTFSLHEKEKEAAGRSTLPFDLARAIEKGDKKTAWLILERARLDGMAAEELLWGVVWKVKDTLAKSRPGDMVHEKAKGVSRSLVEIYHEAKHGGLDFDLAFERLLLSL